MSLPLARVTVELESISCGKCGITFAVPDWWLYERRDRGESGKEFYCPNGHCRVFTESTLDRVKKELAEADRKIAWLRSQREAADRQAAAARGQVTRLRKRVQNGVCPDCHRSFVNLRRHMATKHPQLALPPP